MFGYIQSKSETPGVTKKLNYIFIAHLYCEMQNRTFDVIKHIIIDMYDV